MKILPIPILKDNYSYLLIETLTRQCLAVDPSEPNKILPIIKAENLILKGILTTHHHWDHSGGNEKIAQEFPGLDVFGFDQRIPALTHPLKHDQSFHFGSIKITALHTPCHTSGSLSYFVEDTKEKDSPVVFTGDTLFIGGCGRFFEGTASQMLSSLSILSNLPKSTLVYCGHEYTINNLKFALTVDGENPRLLEKYEWAKQINQTIPSTIQDELDTNPFLRVSILKKGFGLTQDVDAMGKLRLLKDSF